MDTMKLIDSLNAMNQRLRDVLREEPPKWTPEVREQAEHAIAGDFYRFPDGQWAHIDFDVIDWNCNNTSNPAHLIMVLRRFHVLGPLAAGYLATSDERYARTARRYIEAFLRDHPPVEDWQPVYGDGDTEYEIRAMAWMTAISRFKGSAAWDESLLAQMLKALGGNMRYLAKHVRADRNIRFWHGFVLLFAGLRLKGLPGAAEWLAQGRAIVNDGVRRQVLPDGAHMEAVPGYHGGMLELIEVLWRLGRALPELGLNVPTETVAGMYDYLLAATRPDGVTISLHDTRYTPSVAKPGSATRDSRAAFRRTAGLPEQMPGTSAWFPQASQAYIREDWKEASSYLTFDATTRRSLHWHPCRNSITLFAHGRALLVDSGYTFESPQFPRYGHRTAHHNTVNFNGWDQCQSRATLRVAEAPGYSLVEGLYDGGYWPMRKPDNKASPADKGKRTPHWPVEDCIHGAGVFGEHHRILLWIHRRFGVVLDHIAHTCTEGVKPDVETCWQLSEGPAACDSAARRVVTRHECGNLLMLFPVVLPGTEITVHEGERDPMRGWLPIEWGKTCIPAPLVRVVAPAYDPWNGDMASVLVPFAGATPPECKIRGTGPAAVSDARSAGCLWLESGAGDRDLLVWTRRLSHAIERQHGLVTDASLVHLRLDGKGTVVEGLLIDGTCCEYEGVSLQGKLKRVDRLVAGGRIDRHEPLI